MSLAGVALKLEPVRVTEEPTSPLTELTQVMAGWPQALAAVKVKQRWCVFWHCVIFLDRTEQALAVLVCSLFRIK